MKIWQFTQALPKAGLHASGNPKFGYRIVWNQDTEEVLKVKAIYIHDDPIDFTKEIAVGETDPLAAAFMNRVNQETVKA